MIEGITVQIGGQDYILPNLNFRGLQKAEPFMKTLNGLDLTLKMAFLALQRNYPDITEDFIAETLEDYEFRAITEALTANARKKKTTNPQINATGEISTQASLPLQDGLGNILTNT